MPPPANNQDLTTRVSILEHGQQQMEQISDHMRDAVEKLTEITMVLKQMIAVQETKLEFRDKSLIDHQKEIDDVVSRVLALENFRWYISGAVALAIAFVPIAIKFLG